MITRIEQAWDGSVEAAIRYVADHVRQLEEGVVMSREDMDRLLAAAITTSKASTGLVQHLVKAFAMVGVGIEIPNDPGIITAVAIPLKHDLPGGKLN